MQNFFGTNNQVKTRINRGGNFCGHDKYNPCLALAVPSDNKPAFLYSVGEAFKRYFFTPELFPTLNHAASIRQQRSERREAVIVTVLALLEFVDLASLRVGIPTKDGFQPLKLEVLRRRTNLGSRRFERAIQALRESGILTVSEQYKFRSVSGHYVFFPAVRRINKAFFEILNFGKRLVDERLAASKRMKKKAAEAGVKFSQMVKYSLATVAAKYKEWRAQRQAAINAKLTRDDRAQVEQVTRMLMITDNLFFEDARRKALQIRAKLARKRRRKMKALQI